MKNVLWNLQKYNAPKWLTEDRVSYLTVMGSHAYGTNTPESDFDFYGFCLPPVEVTFPHLKGYVPGFSENVPNFENFQGLHLEDFDVQFDLTVYSLPRYFSLCMKGNPNMVDSLFTADECVVKQDNVGKMVRDNKNLFLSQRCWHSFKGMAYSHVSRLRSGHTKDGRMELANKFGYDTKDAYHCVRMLMEVDMVLHEGTLDLQRNKEMLKDVRNGSWTLNDVLDFFDRKMNDLDTFLSTGECAVPYGPDEKAITKLLVDCMEEKYGRLGVYGFGLYK
jgi:predicted nucleotidyltransferase